MNEGSRGAPRRGGRPWRALREALAAWAPVWLPFALRGGGLLVAFVLLAVVGHLSFSADVPAVLAAGSAPPSASARGNQGPSPPPEGRAAVPSSAAAAPTITGSAPLPSQAPRRADGPPARAEGRGRATADDPVYLNDASIDDLQRLPGVGPKRARAIFDLRARLGRFRRLEDLLRVRGIGRATLRKLQPVVRLDRPPAMVPDPATLADAGAGGTVPALL